MSLNNEALQAAYLGEVGGQRFFLVLAEQFEESAAALHVLARLENHIGKRMARLLQRRGLPTENAEAAALQAEKYARTWRTLDWHQALTRMEAEILPFIPQYDLLAEQAGGEDKTISRRWRPMSARSFCLPALLAKADKAKRYRISPDCCRKSTPWQTSFSVDDV
ncbi:hypothetical protein [Cupriavidus metallidurans]|uniref:hypothetical protein n=1 Tax=Cupriavidus metallidurans TaxID=119219 RepID=UPI001CCBAA91|nr:hypothetical protein [Cupriavidus metallidurans]UBM07886.1 hypothetical protein LAI70_09225 [Cupriavidus metallidurans]